MQFESGICNPFQKPAFFIAGGLGPWIVKRGGGLKPYNPAMKTPKKWQTSQTHVKNRCDTAVEKNALAMTRITSSLCNCIVWHSVQVNGHNDNKWAFKRTTSTTINTFYSFSLFSLPEWLLTLLSVISFLKAIYFFLASMFPRGLKHTSVSSSAEQQSRSM